MKSLVTVTIRRGAAGAPTTRVLGPFAEVWSRWRTIGSDPRCDVVLASPAGTAPEVAPLAACVRAGSNHKLLHRLPPGAVLPLPPGFETQDLERVDHWPFEIGPFQLTLGQDYEAEPGDDAPAAEIGPRQEPSPKRPRWRRWLGQRQPA